MRILYLDCFSGISGNMLLGALIDCGADQNKINDHLSKIGNLQIIAERISKNGIMATHVKVAGENKSLNSWSAMQDAVINSTISQDLAIKISGTLKILAEAESHVHGTTLDKLHLHEVGSIDTIADVAGCIVALDLLKIEKIYCSSISLGNGMVNSAHGKIPIPGPATLKLLEGIPTNKGLDDFELTTPTGAALIKGLVDEFCFPDITIDCIGYGSGTYDLPHPNVLRTITGTAYGQTGTDESIWLIETNIDDQNPEHMQYIIQSLLETGAKDAWITSAFMKKGRLGIQLSALADDNEKLAVINKIHEETTSLGVRIQKIERRCLDRKFIEVKVDGQAIKVKVGVKDGHVLTVSPEYEDCSKAAKRLDKPLKEIYFLASNQARKYISNSKFKNSRV